MDSFQHFTNSLLIRTKELGEINTKAIKKLSEQQLHLISNCLDIGVKKISPPKKVAAA